MDINCFDDFSRIQYLVDSAKDGDEQNECCDEKKFWVKDDEVGNQELVCFKDSAIDVYGTFYMPSRVIGVRGYWRDILFPRDSTKEIKTIAFPQKGMAEMCCAFYDREKIEYVVEDGVLVHIGNSTIKNGVMIIPEGVRSIRSNLRVLLNNDQLLDKIRFVFFPRSLEVIGPFFANTPIKLVTFKSSVALAGNTFGHSEVQRIFVAGGFKSSPEQAVRGTIYIDNFSHEEEITPWNQGNNLDIKKQYKIKWAFLECSRQLSVCIVDDPTQNHYNESLYRIYNNDYSRKVLDHSNVNLACFKMEVSHIPLHEAKKTVEVEMIPFIPAPQLSIHN